MKLYLANDHAAGLFKQELLELLKAKRSDLELIDLGTNGKESVDYPDFANKLAAALREDENALGLLICGTGIGISIAANRHKHIRAACCTDATSAKLAREHNDANVLCLGARILGSVLAFDILQAFLQATFDKDSPRHCMRIAKLS